MQMAFDSARRVVVLLGRSQTYEWNGSQWRAVRVDGPPGRYNAAMAYESARKVAVVFGGVSGTGPSGCLNDTWEWDGTSWVQASADNPAFGPAQRYNHAMTYDAARGVVVMYGGIAGNKSLGDTWEWDGISWTQAATDQPTSASPGPREFHEMAYDASRASAVLFGGRANGTGTTNDTGQWNGVVWTRIHTAQAPPLRYVFGMDYHATRGSVVLYGGGGNPLDLGDTWELVGNAWVEVPASGPGPRVGHRLAYDSVRDVMVLLEGGAYDTWEWRTPKAPVVVQQPDGGTYYVGESVRLSQCSVGAGSLSQQWYFDRTNALSGATQSELLLRGIQADQAGAYTLVVSNAFGAVTSAVAQVTVLPCQTAPSGLVSWWRAEGEARDAYGTNHGLLAGSAGFGEGKAGQGFSFTGTNDHVHIPATPSLDLNAARGLTVEGRIKPDDLAPRPLVEWGHGGGDDASVGVHPWSSDP